MFNESPCSISSCISPSNDDIPSRNPRRFEEINPTEYIILDAIYSIIMGENLKIDLRINKKK
jgi:hypothetical protein